MFKMPTTTQAIIAVVAIIISIEPSFRYMSYIGKTETFIDFSITYPTLAGSLLLCVIPLNMICNISTLFAIKKHIPKFA